MKERKQRPRCLETGMQVIRIPTTIYETDVSGKGHPCPMRGRVTYIHPKGRFHTVAFQTRGGIIKESFQGVEV